MLMRGAKPVNSCLRGLFFLIIATFGNSVAVAGTVVLVKPDGQRATIATQGQAMNLDARTGDIEIPAAQSSGQLGDGWCPTTATGAPSVASPALVLVLPSGNRYRVALRGSVLPSWRASQQTLEVATVGQQGQADDGWCPTLPASAPSFTQPLQASPSSVTAPGVTVLSWRTTLASACNTSGSAFPTGVSAVSGWSANMPVQSSGTTLSLSVSGNYRFRLTCTGTGGSVSNEVIVLVSNTPGTTCTGTHAPPGGRTRQNSFLLGASDLWLASNTDWPRNAEIDLTRWHPPLASSIDAQGVNRSFLGRFGANPGDTGTVELKAASYAAFEINTSGFANRAGQISWEQPGMYGAPVLVALSPCPGDFFPSDARCKSNGSAAGGLGWSTGANAPNYCPMNAGQTYYLNVIFGTPTQPAQSTCGFAACRWLFSQGCQIGCGS